MAKSLSLTYKLQNLMIDIPNISKHLQAEIQDKLDNLAKPVGSLGQLEDIALQISMIQDTLSPKLTHPIMLTVASDHRITEEGVSACPVEITWQQVKSFLRGGSGIGLFSRLSNMELWVADAGVNYEFDPHERLIDVKVEKGSRNFLKEAAMPIDKCYQAIENGRRIVNKFHNDGCNVIGFGEMGIGNTTPASALLSVFTGMPVSEAVGPGAGIPPKGLDHKIEVVNKALQSHGISDDPIVNLSRFGGYEIATICGAMLQAAANRMVIITDGFITTAALLVAHAIHPKVVDYAFFSHMSKEPGHQKMVEFLHGNPVLDLGLRLGEGTGSALAYQIIQASVATINEFTSFAEGEISNTSHIKI